MKRILAILLVLALAIPCTSLAATKWAGTEPKSWLEDTSPVTLNMYVNFNWWTADWSDPTAKGITEETGVTVNVMTPVADDSTQLINIINSGDVASMPDIILTQISTDGAVNEMLMESGYAAPLDVLAKEYAPEMFTNCDPDVWNGYVQEDGHTYYLVNFNTAEYYQKMALEYSQLIQSNQPILLLRKDYYEEVGSPDISTPEGFFDTLVKIKALHPDKIAYYEGDSNIASANNADLGMLNYYFGVPLYCEDAEGNLTMNYNSDQWMAAAKFANKMARAGLYTKDSFIDDDATQNAHKFNGDVICYSWTAIEHGLDIGNGASYMAVEPWDSYTQFRTGTGWCSVFVNSQSPNVKRAIRFISFMSSYEGLLAYAGVQAKEGETYSGDPMVGPHYYVDEDGKPCIFKEFSQAMTEDGTLQSRTGATMYWWFGNSVQNNITTWDASDEKMGYLNAVFGPHIVSRPDFANTYLKPAADSEAGTIFSKYRSQYNHFLADIVFAETDEAFDKAVQTFKDEMKAMGIEKLEKHYTDAHNAYLAK